MKPKYKIHRYYDNSFADYRYQLLKKFLWFYHPVSFFGENRRIAIRWSQHYNIDLP